MKRNIRPYNMLQYDCFMITKKVRGIYPFKKLVFYDITEVLRGIPECGYCTKLLKKGML